MIKPLQWKQIYKRNISYNKKQVNTEKHTATIPIYGTYTVYQTIGGRIFVEIPWWWEEKFSRNKHLSKRRKECDSIEEAKLFAENDWKEKAETIMSY
jgi:hypothetical protein